MKTYRSHNNAALVVVLPRLDDAAATPLRGRDLNELFEREQPPLLLLTREGAPDVIDNAIDSLRRSTTLCAVFLNGSFGISIEAWRALGAFSQDSTAEMAFVEILEANQRLRVCDQSVQGSLREVRATLEQRALGGFRSLGLSFEVVSEEEDSSSNSEKHLAITPDIIQTAINLVSAGDYQAALPVLERAAFALRSNSMLFYLKSLAEANTGSVQMALRSCMSAVEHDPKNENARILLQALTSAAQPRDPGNG
jgi:hypothetical protein